MQKIDRSTWPRAEKFGFFSAVSQPFYSVTFRVDVTNLHAYTKQRGLSFYYALVYLTTNAVNAVENFRYTIRDGEVYLLDERIPSFTDLKPGSEDFHIVTLPQEETMEQFCAAAKARSEAQAHFLDQDDKELQPSTKSKPPSPVRTSPAPPKAQPSCKRLRKRSTRPFHRPYGTLPA